MSLFCLRIYRDIVGERTVLLSEVNFQQLVYRECGDAKSCSQGGGRCDGDPYLFLFHPDRARFLRSAAFVMLFRGGCGQSQSVIGFFYLFIHRCRDDSVVFQDLFHFFL